ncbi:MAG: dodecin family protein [Firmicutes bacterium]|nr:dodecin family protein [Bacillota bacterium]
MTVAKIVELVGESKIGWEDAVKKAVSDASKSIDNITGVEVYNWTAQIDAGEIVEYKANVKVAFGVTDR